MREGLPSHTLYPVMPIIVTASVAWNNATEAEVARKNKQIVSLFAKWPTQCKLETNIKGNIHPKFEFSNFVSHPYFK